MWSISSVNPPTLEISDTKIFCLTVKEHVGYRNVSVEMINVFACNYHAMLSQFRVTLRKNKNLESRVLSSQLTS